MSSRYEERQKALEQGKQHRIVLRPTQVELTAPEGTLLRDLLFEQGVEFPCGGQGRCRGCRVRVHEGKVEVNDAQRERLSAEELKSGWRLACQCSLVGDLVVELRQWDAAILADDSPFVFEPRPGLGVAVDLGTTTLVAQLLDLTTGGVLAVRTALNAQARYGADVMSRVEYALAGDHRAALTGLIRRQISSLVEQMDVEPLSHYPFESPHTGLQQFRAGDLGWDLDPATAIRFLPCLGGFVGSDVLAGVLATHLGESEDLAGLVDLGTNGEIVVGNSAGLLCASTAAGPAFEGARISMGMRAATGAISQVAVESQRMVCHVLGNASPQGLCGSGLVDAVAAGLDLEVIQPSGRFSNGRKEWTLAPPVVLTQSDIRELQLAKGAIAAGFRILLERLGAGTTDLRKLYLAGAFGNYISRTSARRIGLIGLPIDQVSPAGNTALLGAKLALFSGDDEGGSYTSLRRKIEHVALKADGKFQEVFVDELAFPQPSQVQA
jgi:uncharacterized 2Fe-2S/4Fe-4S cluster protein (DUF4445 family)